MRSRKKFDCVALKNKIQVSLTKQWKGLSDEEIRERITYELAHSQDPISQKWRSLVKRREKLHGPKPH